jgi:alpha-D-ribose 1-methylphosphonate 5-phosphate C-P lyase
MHALEEYGLMHVKLYEDIARNGHIATTYAYPVKVEGRYVMDPSPTRNSTIRRCTCPAIQLFGAGREKRIYAIPPTPMSSASISRITRSRPPFRSALRAVRRRDSYLDEVIATTSGGRMFVCSDTDYCETPPGRRTPWSLVGR